MKTLQVLEHLPLQMTHPSSKSRTSYIITIASPILWPFKLQTEVALSATEAEYIALSQSTRDILPLHSLLLELSKATKLIVGSATASSTIFEDDKDVLSLLLLPKWIIILATLLSSIIISSLTLNMAIFKSNGLTHCNRGSVGMHIDCLHRLLMSLRNRICKTDIL
jgi:hypothetical protein